MNRYKSLCNQEKFCQSLTNVPKIQVGGAAHLAPVNVRKKYRKKDSNFKVCPNCDFYSRDYSNNKEMKLCEGRRGAFQKNILI